MLFEKDRKHRIIYNDDPDSIFRYLSRWRNGNNTY